jgi:hypothetical protein
MPTTIHAAAEQLRTGRLSPVDLLDRCLERIDRLEPRVHAWVLEDRDAARADARRAADEIARGGWRGPLHAPARASGPGPSPAPTPPSSAGSARPGPCSSARR